MITHISDDITFQYCVHISDIHIRLSSRFKEYSSVFKSFISKIKKLQHKTIVVITGDLFHTKNELTPDCIILTVSFLRQVAKYHPLVIIPGNHDFLMNNMEKSDNISSILHHRSIPNVFYLKESGIFRFGNILFVHNSLWNPEHVPWIHPMSIPNKTENDVIISLYHGQVGKCHTLSGYKLSDTIHLTKFDGSDFVFLGDIHHHQYLAPHIAYAGSMISQNFNETDDHHGFILWDILNKKSKFYPLSNVCCYRQISILSANQFQYNDVIYDDLCTILQQLNPSNHLQIIIYNDCYYGSDIKRQCSTFGITQPRIRHISCDNNITAANTSEQIDCSKSMYHIFQEYLSSQLKMTPSDSEFYIQTLTQHIPMLKDDASQEKSSTSWKILDLSFDNLFGYGKNNHITFDPFPSEPQIIGIFGNNSAGKSTLIDIILFMLYGRISRYSSGNSTPKELIHEKETSFSASLKIQVGSEIFVIKKKGKRDASFKIKIQETILKQDQDGHSLNMSEENRFKSDKIIKNMIGPIDIFLHLCVCLQTSHKTFKEMTQKERKEFLYSLFHLDDFETYRQSIGNDTKDLEASYKSLSHMIEQLQYQSTKEWETEIENRSTQITTLSQQFDVLNIRNNELQLILQDYNQNVALYDQLNKDISQKQQELRHVIDKINSKPTSSANTCYDPDVPQKIETLKTTINQLKSDIKALHSQTKRLPVVPCFNDFSYSYRKLVKDYTPHTIQIECKKLSSSHHPYIPFFSNSYKRKKYIQGIINKISNHVVTDIHKSKQLILNYNKRIADYNIKLQLLQEEFQVHQHVTYNEECLDCKKNPFQKRKIHLCTHIQKINTELQICHQNILYEEGNILKFHKEGLKLLESCDYHHYDDDLSFEDIFLAFKTKFDVDLQHTQNIRGLLEEFCGNHLRKYHKKCTTQYNNYTSFIASLDDFLTTKHHNMMISHNMECLTDRLMRSEEDMSQLQSVILATIQQQQLQQYKTDKSRLEAEIKNNELQISHLKKEMDNNVCIKKEVDDLLQQIICVATNKTSVENTLQHIQKSFDEWRKLSTNIHSIQKNIKENKMLISITDRNGFPLYLLHSIIPVFNTYINKILQHFIDKYIEFQIDEDGNIQFHTKSSDSGMTFHFYGGMESLMIDLATKITFAHFSKCPMSSFFIIDENISVLDEQHIENSEILFNFLKQHFDHILLISHLKTIKNMVDQSIVIKKENGYSHIENTHTPT